MSESREYRTIVSCTEKLKTALWKSDSDIVHFLNTEGFITDQVHDEVLDPQSMWTSHQKSGELVAGIRNKVKLSATSYDTLLKYLRQRGKFYEGIVKILEEAYQEQEEPQLIQPTVQPLEYHWVNDKNFEDGYLKVEVGESATVSFTVEPDLPQLTHAITRATKAKDGGFTTKRFTVKGNSITFKDVRADDSGLYIVNCTNAQGPVGEGEMELEVIDNGGKDTKVIEDAIDSSSGRKGHIVVQGRTLHFKVDSGFHRWQYKHNGTAWDEETRIKVESKGLKSESGARKQALKDLVKKLGLTK